MTSLQRDGSLFPPPQDAKLRELCGEDQMQGTSRDDGGWG